MRRVLAPVGLLWLALVPCAASAAAPRVGAPQTHGPDPASLGARPETAPPLGRFKARVAARQAPSEWCGRQRATDDVAHETANGTFKFHAVYMIPADAPNRFAASASGIQADAFQASALLESDYGRAIRFDMGTSCGPRYLDITVVRMLQSSDQLDADGYTDTGTFDAVTSSLNAAGLRTIRGSDTYVSAAARKRNWVVWLDGPAPPGTCGQASIYQDPERNFQNLNNFGGKVAIVFQGGDGFCSATAVRHEIGHNLGALQPQAPHAFDGSHCDDAIEDTMCYSNSPQVATGERGLFFDFGNDDYWDPPGGGHLPWWTVNLNRFLCPGTACNVKGAAPRKPRARLLVRLRRHGAIWRMKLRATGSGRGVVSVRCRVRRHGKLRTVFSRSTRLPRTLRGRVRCGGSRPKARLKLRAQPR